MSTPLSREAVLRGQNRRFHELLRFVWSRSAFYREYYASHGITERSLDELSPGDLPLLPKKTLIGNFDAAVTDPRLRIKAIEQWLGSHPDPRETFCPDIVLVHGSGTSGDLSIHACDRKAWTIAGAAIAAHLPLPENHPAGRTKAAFYLAAHGHFASIAAAWSMPDSVYDKLIVTLLQPLDEAAAQLTAFQPHRLTGYSSSVAQLAELALDGRLPISPRCVYVGGDKLTEPMERKIRAAWDVPLYVFYAASESRCIALRLPGRDQMLVMDELNIVEVLDENDEAAGAGGEGRVVLTNLYNPTLPMLRYELGDYVVKGIDYTDLPFGTLRDIRGRTNEALPVFLSSGFSDSINPIVLTTLYVPTMEKFQFVSVNPRRVRIDYVAPVNLDAAVRHEFEGMLRGKGAERTVLDVRRVPSIANDPVTGKLRLVRFEAGVLREAPIPC